MAQNICRIKHVAQLRSSVFARTSQAPHLLRPPLLQRSHWTDSRSVPKIAQPSTWNSITIVPKFLRHRPSDQTSLEPKLKKPLNPATYLIIISLLIGSQAIRIIQAQNDFQTYMRKADVQIGKLKEVVDALLRGEEVDIEKALGAADEAQELDWEEALRELEQEDQSWRDRMEDKEGEQVEEEASGAGDDGSPINRDQLMEKTELEPESSTGRKNPTMAGFY